jgi:hypothetical protein
MSKTKAVSLWEETVASYGCVVTRESQPIQVHHVFGRTYKHNKKLIGIWVILPLAFRLHDVSSNDEFNVTHFRKNFARKYGYQIHQFVAMCEDLVSMGIQLPFDEETYQAIKSAPMR